MSHLEESVTAIHVCWQLVQAGVSPELISDKVGRNRAIVYRWIAGIQLFGINKFIEKYRLAKK
ncbi:TPA: hypothetical protein DDZ01_02635, partial [Candidatus Uhrbacteria bacterium]|nr:hypothetical protein [Candidatus Uhrbacteria bacterium]